MCYDTFHSVHNTNNSYSSKSQAYLALTEQEQSEPVDKEQSRITKKIGAMCGTGGWSSLLMGPRKKDNSWYVGTVDVN